MGWYKWVAECAPALNYESAPLEPPKIATKGDTFNAATEINWKLYRLKPCIRIPPFPQLPIVWQGSYGEKGNLKWKLLKRIEKKTIIYIYTIIK